MPFNSAIQMFGHIDNGGYVQLNDNQQLSVQSSFSHALQKVLDSFRALLPSGRAAIEARNNALYDAMARLTGNDSIGNPASSRLEEETRVRPDQRRNMALRMAAGHALSKSDLPPELHDASLRYLYVALDSLLQQGHLSPEKVPHKAAELVKTLPSLEEALEFMSHPLTLDASKAAERGKAMSDSLRALFPSPGIQRKMQPSGICEIYELDAARGLIRSLNDGPVLPAGREIKEGAYGEYLASLMPEADAATRGLVAMLASQSGLGGEAISQLYSGQLLDIPDNNILLPAGLRLQPSRQIVDIHIANGKATISLNMDVSLQIASVGEDTLTTDVLKAPTLLSSRFKAEAHIDLNQDNKGKSCPDFTITFSAQALPEE